ncbi:MAG: hypothetical protein DME24_06495 [Verrucomicrobia bacterium]|nr:MAG: hypothetical protein DME24_06495 [Verrucomicrobiota bacterium]
MPPADEQADPSSTAPQEVVARAFGAENRARLLERYFEQAGPVTTENAWQHVYRLLLWIDRTTALAHCYESDKAQPGRPWYARSLAFHDWVSTELRVTPAALAEEIDWLFREAVKDLAARVVVGRSAAYERQRAPYAGRTFPEPGEDPELAAIIREALGKWMPSAPPDDELRALTRRIHAYLTQENKRKNLVGEGFEDVITAVMRRLHFGNRIQIRTRVVLHDLPGFHPSPPTEKMKKVDLAVLAGSARTLVTAKWSIRADREEQFMSDFQTYERLESAGQDFGYVLITNEFDAARLRAACERRRQNAPLFTHIVHINPAAVNVVYRDGSAEGATVVRTHIASGRLMSLQAWLETVGASQRRNTKR